MYRGSKLFGLLFLVAIILGCACSREGVPDEDVNRQRARSIWEDHERIVSLFIRGTKEEIDFDRYAKACSFFSHLTGIEIRNDMGYVGLMPTRRAVEDIRDIQGWFKLNGDRLYWDAEHQAVILKPRLLRDRGIESRRRLSQALMAWTVHEILLESALKGPYDLIDQVRETRTFFREVAGVDIPVNETPSDISPNARTADSLKQIEKWYQENHSRMYWDAETERVKLRSRPMDTSTGSMVDVLGQALEKKDRSVLPRVEMVLRDALKHGDQFDLETLKIAFEVLQGTNMRELLPLIREIASMSYRGAVDNGNLQDLTAIREALQTLREWQDPETVQLSLKRLNDDPWLQKDSIDNLRMTMHWSATSQISALLIPVPKNPEGRRVVRSAMSYLAASPNTDQSVCRILPKVRDSYFFCYEVGGDLGRCGSLAKDTRTLGSRFACGGGQERNEEGKP